jgi:hypothetical protein
MFQAPFIRYSAKIATLLPTLFLSMGCSSSSDDMSGGGAAGVSSSSGGNNASGGDTATGGADATGSATTGPAPVSLGSAENYVIIAKSAITNVPASVITGDLGLSPSAASFVTGFALTKAGSKWTSPQVVGSVFAADNDAPTPTLLTTAVADMQTAYTDAAGRPTPDSLNQAGGAIGGLTLAPGLYKWTSTVTVPSNVTLAGSGTDTWIFQVTGDLKVSAAQSVILSGGARAENIVWQVAGTVALGATSHFEGIVLSKTGITLGTGASINGRLFAQTAVTLGASTVTAP